MKTIYWIVTGLFCLLMLAAAALEIFAFGESVRFVGDLGFPKFIAYVLPVTKILGVAAIATRKSEILKNLAYAGFLFDFLLAALAHYFANIPSPLPAIVALVILLICYALDRKVYG